MKRQLLAGARALLNPIAWPEPFGLVMVEALACGTPVLAPPLGAAPEIVEHGVTGFLCSTSSTYLSAIAGVDALDRAACRASVATRFGVGTMVRRHEELYQRVILPSGKVRIGSNVQTISSNFHPAGRPRMAIASASTVTPIR